MMTPLRAKKAAAARDGGGTNKGLSVRIIAGTAKGRQLLTLDGDFTRPTSGKVRSALFSILSSWVPGTAWLDLYSGSGAIGLEAASRGATRVVMVESESPAQEVIRANMANTRLAGVELLSLTAEVALRRLVGQGFDVIFLDPPYKNDPEGIMEAIAQSGLLLPKGRLVVEHRSTRVMPSLVGSLGCLRTARYSDSSLSFYSAEPLS
jgi:16S rRNA (guanine966-N2)-methyltransferase